MLTQDDENSGSIRDELISAFRGGSEGRTPDTPTAEVAERQEAAPQETRQEPQEKPETTEREATAPESVAEDKPEKKEPAKAKEPPVRWTKEEKEEFLGLDPKVQEILLSRNKSQEQAFTRRMTELAQERQRYQGLEQVLAPRREEFSRQGLDDARAINMVFSYWDQAQRDPLGFIDQFARQRGLDLTQIYGPTTEQLMEYMGGGSGPGASPDGSPAMHPIVQRQFQELQQQNEQLQHQLAQMGSTFQGWQQQQQQSVQNAARSEFDTFRNAVDDKGEPRYPFFEELRSDMAQLMRSGYASNLAEAYDKAQRVRPDVWSKIQENQDLTRRRAEEQRIREEAAKAKRAGASLSQVGSSSVRAPTGDDEENSLSLRELITKQFAQSRAGSRI
jgi:hypothetical protein